MEAREGLKPGERGASEILLSTMDEYYGGASIEGQPIETDLLRL